MSEIFINMNRTLCHRTLRVGGFRGAYAVTARFNDDFDIGTLTRLAGTLVKDPAIAACEIWTAVDPAGQPVSMEEKLRGGDKKIKACLMADTLRQAEAEKLGEQLAKQFPTAEVGVFRVLCQLGNGGA
jgi:tryptophanase